MARAQPSVYVVYSSALDTLKPTSLRPRTAPAAAAPEAAEEVGESDMGGGVRRGGAAFAATGTLKVLSARLFHHRAACGRRLLPHRLRGFELRKTGTCVISCVACRLGHADISCPQILHWQAVQALVAPAADDAGSLMQRVCRLCSFCLGKWISGTIGVRHGAFVRCNIKPRPARGTNQPFPTIAVRRRVL